MTIDDIRPADFPWFRYDGYSFSLGLTDGDTAWLSGHSASEYDPTSRRIVVRGPMAAQASTAYDKIFRILDAAGFGPDDVVHVVENVTGGGLGAIEDASNERRRRFGRHEPAVTTIVVDHLLRRDALLEVQVSAARGGGQALPSGGRCDGRTVHLPIVLPLDDRGAVVHQGDFVRQYQHCLQGAASILRGAGLSSEHIVRTIDYTTPATREQYPSAAGPRREMLGPVDPAGAGIVMSSLHAPGVLVALEVTASTSLPQLVDAGWDRYDELTYSPAVTAGDTMWLSGFAALDPASGSPVHCGDVLAQAEYTYATVQTVLTAGGIDTGHLLSTVEFVCPDGLADYRGVAGIRQRLLRAPWPASTGIVCQGLLPPELLFEVVPTARLEPIRSTP